MPYAPKSVWKTWWDHQYNKIDLAALVRTQEIDLFTAAEKLPWAAHRNVTREEDEVYSLLGLFEVYMPLVYGEGRKILS